MIIDIRQHFGRPAGCLIVTKYRHKFIGKRGGGAIEQRQIAALMAEKPDGRKHPVNRRHQPRGQIVTEIDVALPKRQKIEQQIQHDPRIAGNMPAIWKNLAFHFLRQLHSVPSNMGKAGRHGDGRDGQRNPDPQPRFPIRRMFDDPVEITHVKRKTFQETTIKTRIGLM
ncbi:hypothetical protein D3C72_1843760 [compost metagenome]